MFLDTCQSAYWRYLKSQKSNNKWIKGNNEKRISFEISLHCLFKVRKEINFVINFFLLNNYTCNINDRVAVKGTCSYLEEGNSLLDRFL